ncbi:MAG: serine/threonine-protein phosphatase, partial [Bryobacteraceae bacterium]
MQQIRCAEIWGGVSVVDLDVCTNGLTASILSTASGGKKGGDIYYFSVCSSDKLTRIAIADLRGHGEQVSHLSEWLYQSLEQRMNTLDGAGVLSDLNGLVHAHGFEAIT